jgi:hypothetical protein
MSMLSGVLNGARVAMVPTLHLEGVDAPMWRNEREEDPNEEHVGGPNGCPPSGCRQCEFEQLELQWQQAWSFEIAVQRIDGALNVRTRMLGGEGARKIWTMQMGKLPTKLKAKRGFQGSYDFLQWGAGCTQEVQLKFSPAAEQAYLVFLDQLEELGLRS